MTTERAIELLNRISDSQFDGEHGDERREALSMAVRVLEGDGGTISRQQAIEALDKHIDTFDAIDTNYLCGLRTAMSILKEMPSAQPQQRWIPCGKCIHADGNHRWCKILDRSINEDYFCCWAKSYREEGGK